jgi:membrane fusion protein (multidrug efflux system)
MLHPFLFFLLIISVTAVYPREREKHLVETTLAQKQSLPTTVTYTGTLVPKRIAKIFTQEAGRIVILPHYEGDFITTGTLLLQLDDVLLQAELEKAIAVYRQAQVDVQRLQKLADKGIVSKDELDRAKTQAEIARIEENILKIRLSRTQIKAPLTGFVSARLVEVGDVVTANTHIMTLIDPTSLVVEVEIPEKLMLQLPVDKKKAAPSVVNQITISIDALNTKPLIGSVSRIGSTVDPNTRLGKLEITLNSLPSAARSGQFCRVTFSIQNQPQLILPYRAVRRDTSGEYVFIVDSTQKVQRQTVRTGQYLAEQVEITEGLSEGQQVITRGFLGLQAGMMVHIVNH